MSTFILILTTIAAIILYLLVGALVSFIWRVWTLCYREEWDADFNSENGGYVLCTLFWPLMIFLSLFFVALDLLMKVFSSNIFIKLHKVFDNLARKLAKHCTDFKNRNH